MVFANYQIIDLSHAINPNVPTWTGCCGFKSTIKCDYEDCETETKFRAQKFEMVASIATHMDAPAHCFAGAATIDQLELSNLLVPAVVIDISQKIKEADDQLTVQDIQEFESAFGTIPSQCLVIIYTGWSKHWNDPEKYRNADKQGLLHFPTVSAEAAEFLFSRQIVGIGVDVISPDRHDSGYPTHRIFLGNGKYIIENVANAHKLPPTGSFVLVMPLKIEGATESPIRLVGLILK